MTVSTDQNRATLIASGTTKDFDFSFPYLDSADMRVFFKTSAGVESELGPSDFSVSNPGGGTGGRISLTTLPLVNTIINILRDPALVQETDLQENSSFYLETIERSIDRLTMISQRTRDLQTRSLTLGDADLAGAGSYRAGGNRITALAYGTDPTDATTLAQVQAIVAAGGGAGTGSGPTWPTDPVPQDVVDQVISNASVLALFSPINVQLGNLSSQVLALNSNDTAINTSIGSINTTLDGMQASIDTLQQLQGDGTAILTAISTETTQRIDGDNALAAVQAKIGAADPDGVSFLLNLDTAKVGSGETLAQRFSSITAAAGANTAAINAESTARISADGVTATTIAKIGALADSGASFLLDLNTVKVGSSETLAQRLSAITSATNANSSAITSEQSTRATADSSLAASITTLQSNVSGYSVSIQQNATAINGVQAKYSVKVDNNGKVSGFGLISDANNGTPVSVFAILADAFKVYNGTTDIAPFSVSGGSVFLQNVIVGSEIRQGQTAYDTGTGFWLGDVSGTPKFSLGNSAGNKMTWDGTTLSLTGNLNMTNSAQTFTPTWTGFSSSPSGALSYLDLGAFVVLWSGGGTTGASNSTAMTITNLPSGIRPTSGNRFVPCLLVDNDGLIEGAVNISGATMTFYKTTAQGASQPYPVFPSSAGFTTGGAQKGVGAGFMIVYPK